jgi:sterol desaturase/sphingolipid hydroxylase (fatty acid hydroxylase superfamily)
VRDLLASLPLAATASLFVAAFALASAAETVWPLRTRRVEPRARRAARNLSLGGVSLAVATLLQIPVLAPVAAWADSRGVGLLRVLPLPGVSRVILGVLLLDYTLWVWHWANHRVPLLWRFHLVHHVDLDMDASTALRFHFGEMALSVLYRALQVVALGVDPAALALWQGVLTASILFHHSNTRLPDSLERAIVRLVVTPRMHGIHHTAEEGRTNSNWSSLLSIWDVLHGTFRWGGPDDAVIGVPAWQDPRELTLGRLLRQPFGPKREDWVPR